MSDNQNQVGIGVQQAGQFQSQEFRSALSDYRRSVEVYKEAEIAMTKAAKRLAFVLDREVK